MSMDYEEQRNRRANTVRWLESHGAVEGHDWCWGPPDGWSGPGVVDTGPAVELWEELTPADKADLPIMVRSSAVRLLGGVKLAAAMDEGRFPSEMPFAVGAVPRSQFN